SPGEIGTSYNDNFAKAVAAFQAASGLPAIGAVDSTTWAALNDDQSTGHVEQKQVQPQGSGSGGPQKQKGQPNAPMQPPGQVPNQPPNSTLQGQAVPPPVVISYTITMEDASGPFTKLPKVSGRDRGERLLLQEAKLPRLNYESPLQLLAEKFHASPRLLVEL